VVLERGSFQGGPPCKGSLGVFLSTSDKARMGRRKPGYPFPERMGEKGFPHGAIGSAKPGS
jgi:hypothetical protein